MSRFADRYSGTQLRMLDALGYRLLERVGPVAAGGSGVLAAAANDASDPRVQPAEQAGAAARLPRRIVIERAAAGAPLLAAIRAAATLAGDGGRLDSEAGELHIEIGGAAPEWRVALDALRGSARHKGALWRALRGMRTLRGGGGRP